MLSAHPMFLFEAEVWNILEELFLTTNNWFCVNE